LQTRTFCGTIGKRTLAPRFLFMLKRNGQTGSNNRLKSPGRSCRTRFEKTKRNHREAATKNRYMAQVNRASAVHSTREFAVATGSCSRKTASLKRHYRFITSYHIALSLSETVHNEKPECFQNNQSCGF